METSQQVGSDTDLTRLRYLSRLQLAKAQFAFFCKNKADYQHLQAKLDAAEIRLSQGDIAGYKALLYADSTHPPRIPYCC